MYSTYQWIKQVEPLVLFTHMLFPLSISLPLLGYFMDKERPKVSSKVQGQGLLYTAGNSLRSITNVTKAAAVTVETHEEHGSDCGQRCIIRSLWILTEEQFERNHFFILLQALLGNTTNDNLKSNTTLYLQDPTLTDGVVFK